MKYILVLILITCPFFLKAQTDDALPYYELTEITLPYTANSVAVRMVDGLGFRYFWATEGLRDEDLNYKPSETGRETMETIEHIYALSRFIRNGILINNKDITKEILDFETMRKQTLWNFKLVSDVLKDTNQIYKLENSEVPFWNIINGPISDALWHCGQVVLLRRSSGNPFNPKVNLFSGTVKK